jgi:hypothetical protein
MYGREKENSYKVLSIIIIIIIITWPKYTFELLKLNTKIKNKLRGLSPRANYTDRATAACRRS